MQIAAAINRHPRRALAGLVLLGVLFMLIWGGRKSPVGFHIDEIWQYSYANSYGKDLYAITAEDFGKWLPPTVFRDYITVQPGQRFSYPMINKSSHRDVHPPLSHYALNTVASLFPNVFSKWFGLAINIACYALTLCALYGLALRFFVTPARALFATALWGFSLGAIDTVMYIRMYCPLTMFAVASAWLLVKYDRSGSWKYLALTYSAFILGGLTDYTFWIFGFLLTACYGVLRCRRAFARAAIFCGAALAAFVTTCLVFPLTVMQFVNEHSISRDVGAAIGLTDKLRQFVSVRTVFERFLTYAAEQVFYMSPAAVKDVIQAGAALALAGFIALAVVSLLVVLLAEAGSREDLRSQSGGDVVDFNRTLLSGGPRLREKTARVMRDNLRRVFARAAAPAERPWYVLVAAVACAYVVAVLFPDFQLWTVRGFFYVYPFLSILLALVLVFVFDTLRLGRKTKIIFALLMIALAVREYTVVQSPFLFRESYKKLPEKLEDANVIFVLDSLDSLGRMANFTPSLAEANSVYVLVITEGDYRKSVMHALDTMEPGHDVKFINTCGVPPISYPAMEIIGKELLLTNDKVLESELAARGYRLEMKKMYALVFQVFSLYSLKPIS